MAKKNRLSSAGKNTFIYAMLEMLDEGTALQDLNLRKIARRIGCAHTNAYNYFGSFEDLLWWGLREALERMVGIATGDGAEETIPDSNNLIEEYVDFALQHPAWYHLIWIEPLSGEPPREVAEYLDIPSRLYTEWLANCTGREMGNEELAVRGRILHAYIHGELAAISSGRVRTNPKTLRTEVLTHTARLFALLFPETHFFLKEGV